MAKKKKVEKKEVNLDDLESELSADIKKVEEEPKEEAKADEEKIEEIEEFSLDEISEEEEISDVFDEELEEREEVEEEVEAAPKEEIIEERIYTIPLAKARRGPRNKWAKKAIRYLKEFTTRHMKPESIVISQEVNERIWSRGIQKPPRKLKVRVTKNVDGLCVIYAA